jgi:hypothetical protein
VNGDRSENASPPRSPATHRTRNGCPTPTRRRGRGLAAGQCPWWGCLRDQSFSSKSNRTISHFKWHCNLPSIVRSRIDAKHLRNEEAGQQTFPGEFLRTAKQERIGEGPALRASVGSTEATSDQLASVSSDRSSLRFGKQAGTGTYGVRVSGFPARQSRSSGLTPPQAPRWCT